MFSKVSKTKKWLIGISAGCLSVSMCATGCVLGLRNNANAITNNDTTSYVKVGEIFNGKRFNEDTLNTLLQYVSGNSSVTYDNMSSLNNTTKTSAQMKANAVGDKTADKDIIVTFGGLDWEVVYLSPDKSSNPTLTLWLSNNAQSAFSGRSQTEGLYHGYYNGALYSDWSADWSTSSTSNGTAAFYPSAMYGTSYMRSVTLNNGGQYATSNTALAANPGQNSSSAFAKFTMSSVSGNVTQFLTKPRQMSWQENQSNKEIRNQPYNYPNEAWSKSTADDGFYSAAYNYAEHDGSDAWADDYLWLPSMAESYTSGLWNTSTEQRANYDGSTTSISASVGSNNVNNATSLSGYSWLRSGGNSGANTAYYLSPSGSSNSKTLVYSSRAVRPALHLNLNSAAKAAGEETWLDYADTNWNGDGLTEATAYRIDTPAKLAGIAAQVKAGESFSGKYFKQTADLSLSGYAWSPIGTREKYFAGIYDGDGYKLTGVSVYSEENDVGLFGYGSYGTFKNIYISNSKFQGGVNTGAICGTTSGTIMNCYSSAVVIGDGTVGGIVGTYTPISGNQLSGCISYATVDGNIAGSIAGYVAYGTIKECAGFGLVLQHGKTPAAGGIVGRLNSATMQNCSFVGESNSDINPIANIYGTGTTISSCYGYVKNMIPKYSDGDFAEWRICKNVNSDLPILKALYYVAQFGDSVDAAWFTAHGFEKI